MAHWRGVQKILEIRRPSRIQTTNDKDKKTMDKLPSPIGPSAQIPLLGGCRLRFAKALAAKVSPWALTKLFPRLVRELKHVPKTRNIKLEDTMRLFEQVGADVWDLFHTIPRDLLESLILGTVAFDNSRAHNRVTGLMKNGPGIYVLGLSIIGRDGQFLNGKELDLLILGLQTYIHGSSVLRGAKPAANRSVTEKAAVQLVARVDSTYGSGTPGCPRFICDDENEALAGHLLSSLQARRWAMFAADPTQTICSIQSPQYVGCSKDVGTRISAYELGHGKSALAGANKFFALTVNLLRYQGLFPKVHVVAAIRTWKAGQLSAAEMLVSALAGAYVTQDGFNLRDAGGNHDSQSDGTWDDHELYVFGAVDHFDKNIDWSMADLEKLQFVEDRLKAMDAGALQRAQDGCDAELEDTSAKVLQLQQHADDIIGVQLEQAKIIQALDEECRMWGGALKVVEGLQRLAPE